MPETSGASSAANADVWVVVPALNEASVVGPTVRELRGVFPNVVVVDDGSADGTGEEAAAAGALVVRHPINLGQGAALQTGLECALARGARLVATFDADGQHHASDLERMADVVRAGDADVALGSRFLGRAENIPPGRRLALRVAVVFTSFSTGVRLTDAHNGLRVFSRETARRLHLVQDRMAHASEVVATLGRLGVRIVEVPVTISYTPYSLRKGQRLSHSVRVMADLVAGWLLR